MRCCKAYHTCHAHANAPVIVAVTTTVLLMIISTVVIFITIITITRIITYTPALYATVDSNFKKVRDRINKDTEVQDPYSKHSQTRSPTLRILGAACFLPILARGKTRMEVGNYM